MEQAGKSVKQCLLLDTDSVSNIYLKNRIELQHDLKNLSLQSTEKMIKIFSTWILIQQKCLL